MNKLLKIPMLLLLIGSLVACGDDNNDNSANSNDADKATLEGSESDSNSNAKSDTESDNTMINDPNDNNGKVRLADDVATEIANLEEVESANVFVTDNNAYVAVMLKDNISETDDIKKKIGDKARESKNDFKNVYVTTNPDFIQQFNDYGDKLRTDQPVEGFFDEFTETIKRVFPESS